MLNDFQFLFLFKMHHFAAQFIPLQW